MSSLLVAQAAVTTFLCGLIWAVQVVHYPLFARVGRETFAAYEREHQSRVTWIVMPTMLAELAIAAWLTLKIPAALPAASAWLGMALVGLIWLVTWWASVPSHRILSTGFETTAHRRLVRTNWLRTGAWTLRSVLAFWMLLREGTVR